MPISTMKTHLNSSLLVYTILLNNATLTSKFVINEEILQGVTAFHRAQGKRP